MNIIGGRGRARVDDGDGSVAQPDVLALQDARAAVIFGDRMTILVMEIDGRSTWNGVAHRAEAGRHWQEPRSQV